MKHKTPFTLWLEKTEVAWQEYLKDRARYSRVEAYKRFYAKIPK